VTIFFDGGSFFRSVDQTVNGGAWQLLASGLNSVAGTNGYVTIGNNTGETGKVVMADALRWSYSASQDNPANGTVPRWWADYYFGTEIDASQDYDEDGYSTYAEYIVGTVPNDPDSRLQVRAEPNPPSGLRLIFSPFLAGRIYALQRATNLNVGGWLDLPASAASATNGEGVIAIISQVADQSFYHLSVRLAP
jgi:hypothetical protein